MTPRPSTKKQDALRRLGKAATPKTDKSLHTPVRSDYHNQCPLTQASIGHPETEICSLETSQPRSPLSLSLSKHQFRPPFSYRLTVRLLEARASTLTTELLGLAATVVGNEESAVVLGQGLLEGVLAVLVDVFLVVGDQGLGDGLADGVDLRGVATTADANADVDLGELVNTNDEERLVDLRFG